MNEPLTKERIQREVGRFWRISAAKQREAFADFYSDRALVFTTSSKRLEPGRLVTVRRSREYLESAGQIRVQLSAVDVLLLGPDAAVAFYTFELHVTNLPGPATAPRRHSEEHIDSGRATQVFSRDSSGALKIFHEHLSVAQAGTAK